MKAFERMEKAEQRRQEAQARLQQRKGEQEQKKKGEEDKKTDSPTSLSPGGVTPGTTASSISTVQSSADENTSPQVATNGNGNAEEEKSVKPILPSCPTALPTPPPIRHKGKG